MATKMTEIQHLIDQKQLQTIWGPKVEELDKLQVQGILIKDKDCRKLKMGKVP
jgi:hypothetical protein